MKKSVVNLILIVILFLLMGCTALYVLWKQHVFIPEFAPVTIDKNAIKEDEKGNTVSSHNNIASLSYSNIVSVNSDTKKIDLYFKNASKSQKNILLYIIIKKDGLEQAIAESGLIPVGYALYHLDLKDGIILNKGGYNGIFRIAYYNEETGSKEVVDTEIDVSIDVK